VKAPPGTVGPDARQEAGEGYQSGRGVLVLSHHQPRLAAEGCTIGRVRKLLKWIVVTIGVTALVRWFKRRGADADVVEPTEPATADPAEELRKKLAESREADEPGTSPEPPDATVEERRADVHEQGRTTLDEMKPSDES
jgi:hypothetical protein